MEEHNKNDNDDLGTPLKILSFCIWPIGMAVYFTKRDTEPIAAKQAFQLTIFGFIIGIMINVILSMIKSS